MAFLDRMCKNVDGSSERSRCRARKDEVCESVHCCQETKAKKK